MDCWAAYLRGEAALGLPIIDTSRPIAENVAALAAHAEELAALRRQAQASQAIRIRREERRMG